MKNIRKLKVANLPTPIQKLKKVSNRYGKSIYIKRDDMTGIEFSGNKIRKLEYLVAYALEKNIDTLITAGGVQSNHARATSAICARYGLSCHLVLTGSKDSEVDGNLWLDYMLGSTIHFIDTNQLVDKKMSEIYSELKSYGKNPLIVPIGASNSIGSLGYINAFSEIIKQEQELNLEFDSIVTAVGSGGTYAGLLAGDAKYRSKKRIQGFSVNKSKKVFQEDIEKILIDMGVSKHGQIHINDSYIGSGYAISQDNELVFYRNLAQEEGIILDPCYTGKAFYGLVNELDGDLRDSKNILFIHTGGLFGWKYEDKQRALVL